MTVTLPVVRPGQVWADMDKRSNGRTVRVERVEGDTAVCTSGPRTVRISVRRFRPNSTGYRLVSSPPPVVVDIPAGQDAASLFLTRDADGELDLRFKHADGRVVVVGVTLDQLAGEVVVALTNHLAATLPIVTDL